MTAVSGKLLPVGLRSAVIFELSAAGYPKATDETAYAGVAWEGPKAFSLTMPKPRPIAHYGGDRVLGTDVLPPTEAASGQLTVADYRFDIHALLTDTNVITVGEAKEIAWGTNKQGFEPQVGLLLYQQAIDLVSGARRYHCYVIPKAIITPSPANMSDKTEDVTYDIVPQIVSARLWGIPLVDGTDGYVSTQIFEYMTDYKPTVVSFLGDGATLEFSFPAGAQCANIAKAIVTVNGVKVTANLTISTSKLTWSNGNAPAANAEIVCFYEAS